MRAVDRSTKGERVTLVYCWSHLFFPVMDGGACLGEH